MSDNQPKEGDQVSWQWSGSRPGGEVTDVKEDGKVEMTTKNNNVVSKKGEPGNPAVKIERSGHDVVKKANEVDVEESGDKHKEAPGDEKTVEKDGEKKDDDKKDEKQDEKDEKKEEKKENGEAETGDKRKAEDSAEEKKAEENGDDSKKQKTDEEKPQENGDAPKKKGRPAKKSANGEAAPKKENKKKEPKKAATESGEPRRSGRNRS